MKRFLMVGLFLLAAGSLSAQTDTTRHPRPGTKTGTTTDKTYPPQPNDSLPRKDTLTPIDPRNTNPENRDPKNGSVDPLSLPQKSTPAPTKKKRR